MATLDHESPAQHDPYAAFRHRAFWIYAGSYVLAVISSSMLAASAKFDVEQLTHGSTRGAAFYLGLLGLVAALPVMFLSLLAGHVIDRANRRTVLLCTQAALSVTPLVYAAIAHRGAHTVWSVYGIVLANAVALTFARPTRNAFIVSTVPRATLNNAITWNSTIFETSGIVGPAIAGLIIGGYDLHVALYVSAAAMVACFVVSFALPKPTVLAGRAPATFQSLVAGLRFVFRTRLLLASMSLDLFAVLFGGATYLMPIFARELGVGARGYGFMLAAPAVGAITSAVIQAHRKPYDRAGRAMLLAIVGFGLATIVFGLSHNYWLSLAMLVLIGAADNVNVVVRHTLVQLLTPDSMRGRVGAVNQVFIGASNELGGLESGLTATSFGLVPSVVGGGVAVIGVCAVVAARFPEVLALGRLRDVVAGAEEPAEEPTLRTTAETPAT